MLDTSIRVLNPSFVEIEGVSREIQNGLAEQISRIHEALHLDMDYRGEMLGLTIGKREEFRKYVLTRRYPYTIYYASLRDLAVYERLGNDFLLKLLKILEARDKKK